MISKFLIHRGQVKEEKDLKGEIRFQFCTSYVQVTLRQPIEEVDWPLCYEYTFKEYKNKSGFPT